MDLPGGWRGIGWGRSERPHALKLAQNLRIKGRGAARKGLAGDQTWLVSRGAWRMAVSRDVSNEAGDRVTGKQIFVGAKTRMSSGHSFLIMSMVLEVVHGRQVGDYGFTQRNGSFLVRDKMRQQHV